MDGTSTAGAAEVARQLMLETLAEWVLLARSHVIVMGSSRFALAALLFARRCELAVRPLLCSVAPSSTTRCTPYGLPLCHELLSRTAAFLYTPASPQARPPYILLLIATRTVLELACARCTHDRNCHQARSQARPPQCIHR